MTKRLSAALVAAATFIATSAVHAAVHRVYPGESIQAAIDAAAPGDTILVEPGDYYENANSRYGLRIATNDLRLIGKSNRGKGKGKKNKVRLIANGDQETGVLAAPPGCEYDWKREQCAEVLGEDFEDLKGFYIRGFSVEGYPVNGIQTRWVDGFEFVRNESANNLNNGIYPTLSANGLVRNNVSYGSLDTAMWVAGSENVRVMGNELRDSVIGFEITVSNNVKVTHNEIYNNTVGVGLFHPNGAGNPPLPEMKNWVIKQNEIYDNNRENDAPPNSFQADLPPGAGVLLLGVSDHVITKNNIEDNEYVGVAVLGWCSSLFGTPRACTPDNLDDLRGPPESNNNLIYKNNLDGNGVTPGPIPFLTVDLGYLHIADLDPAFEPIEPPGTGNCFKQNKPKNGVSHFSSQADGELPTDGC